MLESQLVKLVALTNSCQIEQLHEKVVNGRLMLHFIFVDEKGHQVPLAKYALDALQKRVCDPFERLTEVGVSHNCCYDFSLKAFAYPVGHRTAPAKCHFIKHFSGEFSHTGAILEIFSDYLVNYDLGEYVCERYRHVSFANNIRLAVL